MKTIINNTSINLATLTYGQLKSIVPSTEGIKLPTAKKLTATGEVLFSVQDGDTLVTVYTNGFLTFTQPDETVKLRTTVYAVDRCEQIVYEMGCSKAEVEEGWGRDKQKVAFSYKNGGLTKYHIVTEEHYKDVNWIFPVSYICERRLEVNGDAREDSHIEYRFGGEDWGGILVEEDFVTKMAREEEEEAEEIRNKKLLAAALETLTPVQRKVVDYYYYSPGMTEQDIADLLGCTQQAVHKNLAAALKKMKKFFEKSGC